MRWGVTFAGVGGVDWGIKAAGQRVVWAVERDPVAAEWYRRNHPGTSLIEADVQAVDVTELANIDALWASPPCQGVSQARNKILAPRDDVWVGREILRYVAELEPRIVMIENVPQYRNHLVYKEIVAGLLNLGYAVQARVLNCADYGIPQTRQRLIVQARRDGCIAWPATAARVGWYAAIGDIMPPPAKPLAPWQARRWDAAYNALGPVILDGQFKFDSPGDRQLRIVPQSYPVPCIMASDHSIKHVVYPVLVDNQWRYGEAGMRLFQASEPPSTVLASDGSQKDVIYPAVVPMRARLTTRCNARLQTLPDDATWPGSYGAAMKLIGNAVPSRLAQLLAESAATGARIWQPSLLTGEAA